MKSSREIAETIAKLQDEMDAIVAVSNREERDLSQEETARINEIADNLLPAERKAQKTAIAVEREMLNRGAKRFEDAISDNQAKNEAADAGSIAAYRSASIRIPARAKVHGKLNAFRGPDAEKDAYIAGMVVLAGLKNHEPAKQFCRANGLQIQGTMSSSDNTSGGFLVPDEMQAAIVRLREERGVFPQFANNIPMGADIIRVPRLLSDVTAYWTGEGDEITASDPTIGSAELMARKLACLTRIPSELDEDAVIQVGDMVTTSMAYAMADKIDDAAFNGDGTSTYGGVMGLKNVLNASAIQDAATGNTSALTLDFADFEACVGKYPQYPGANPRWFVHSAVYWASMARLMDAAGGNTIASLEAGPSQMMFMGYPVTFVQVLPSTTGASTSTILAYFGDLRLGATYGTRRSVRTEVSTDRYFEQDLIAIRTTERVAITIHERGDTIRTRPIVALKTASV